VWGRCSDCTLSPCRSASACPTRGAAFRGARRGGIRPASLPTRRDAGGGGPGVCRPGHGVAWSLLGPRLDCREAYRSTPLHSLRGLGFGVANGAPAVRIDRMGPDNYWFGARPQILLDRRGAGVDEMIAQVRAAVASYPYPNTYRPWPGPNSNTFLAHIARQVPDLAIQLPSNAVGKDFLPGGGLFAAAPSGSGFQLSLYGLFGILLAAREGLVVKLLGLGLGVDPVRPAFEAAGPRQARDGGPIEWQPPLTSIAAPGSAARSPSLWRATRRHASRCIRARRREPQSDAAGR
jgi:hypothetical protein